MVIFTLVGAVPVEILLGGITVGLLLKLYNSRWQVLRTTHLYLLAETLVVILDFRIGHKFLALKNFRKFVSHIFGRTEKLQPLSSPMNNMRNP